MASLSFVFLKNLIAPAYTNQEGARTVTSFGEQLKATTESW
jgi:hypothetical protein